MRLRAGKLYVAAEEAGKKMRKGGVEVVFLRLIRRRLHMMMWRAGLFVVKLLFRTWRVPGIVSIKSSTIL